MNKAENLNGSAHDEPIVPQRTVLPQPHGAKVIYTSSTGLYLGAIEFETVSTEALAAIANDFQAFAADQTRSLQIVQGAGVKPS
jgi:hypothetical protein